MADLRGSDTSLTSSLPPEPAQNALMTSVSAGQSGCGAPRRNRTGDPILTMNRQPSAVLASVLAAHDGPSGAKVCAQFVDRLDGAGLEWLGALSVGGFAGDE